MLTIGEGIRIKRKQKKLSMKALAELTGIGRTSIWRIEHNLTSVNSDYVYALCDVFDCDANALFYPKTEQTEKK